MFTGIIEEVNRVHSITNLGKGATLDITATEVLNDLAIGDSISVNGVCLTVIYFNDTMLRVEAVEETMIKSSIAKLRVNSEVNLERALRVGGKLGGHFVQGHVDCTATITEIEKRQESWLYRFEFPKEYDANIIPVGSICIDGVSLTVAEKSSGQFAVSVIPHTYENTLFRSYKLGSIVNIEVDMIGKYVLNFIQAKDGEGLSSNRLSELGY
jgi:riboflavin synthase